MTEPRYEYDRTLIMKLAKIIKRFRIGRPKEFRLTHIDPADTCGLDINKREAKAIIANGIQQLTQRQEMLYAHDRWAVLGIFQAMDAAGKDSAIKHVMSGVNPQGCQVFGFKAPSHEELDHDFLWRAYIRLPERGRIGIFNRSYYEEVLVVRVHPELLERQRLPPELIGKDIWEHRFKAINAFERHLARNGTRIVKFHLRVSREEQRKRLLERLDEPAKRWKFSMDDIAERSLWDKYMVVYEQMIRETSTEEAPWYVVPADNKWFARLVVAAVMVDELKELPLEYPKVEGLLLEELERVRQMLEAEQKSGSGKA
jgi:PPK2 family polyphosphate:nucleotide phosphotransferase